MTNVRQNFTIPEETGRRLKALIADRKRSAFVAEAIEDKLKQLEEEDRRLKQMVADLSLDRHMLQEVIRKKM